MSLSQRKDQLNSTEPKSGVTVKAAKPLALHCGGSVTSVNRTLLSYQVKKQCCLRKGALDGSRGKRRKSKDGRM